MKFDVAEAKIVDKNLRPVTIQKAINSERLPHRRRQPPVSPRTGGYEYVWHCHILEHEEHDMMHTVVSRRGKDRSSLPQV